MSDRYAIYRADEPLDGLDGECWEFRMEVPPELVEALTGATPEEMQEAADAIVCLKAGLKSLKKYTTGDWGGTVAGHASGVCATRAEALRALAEQVKGAKADGAALNKPEVGA